MDVPGLRIGRCIYDTPVLADGVCALSARKSRRRAESKQAAEAALELIEVQYDELEPLLDPVAASKTVDGASSDLLSQRSPSGGKAANVFAYLSWGKGESKPASSKPT